MTKKGYLFAVGGSAYVALELLWRGRSHYSMFLLGGGCFLAIGELGRRTPKLPGAVRAVIGSGICTAGELLTGMLVNRDYAVWDYRELPGNYRGQICLPFSLLWVPLSAFAGTLYRFLDGGIVPNTKKVNIDIAKNRWVRYNKNW